MKVAIMQPYFFPYLGYWQLIASVDKFVVYDDVNYIKNGWINRNRILINDNASFITIPLYQASSNKKIYQIDTNTQYNWRSKVFKSIQSAYGRAPFYSEVISLIDDVLSCQDKNISDYLLNHTRLICQFLGIKTEIVPTSRKYNNDYLSGKDRVIDICQKEAASTYINLDGGKALYNYDDFSKSGIELQFICSELIDYKQMSPNFISHLSIIDVMMSVGREATAKLLNKYRLS